MFVLDWEFECERGFAVVDEGEGDCSVDFVVDGLLDGEGGVEKDVVLSVVGFGGDEMR